MIFHLELKDSIVEEIQTAMHDWCGITFTSDEIGQILLMDLSLIGDLVQHGDFDTCNRETFGDLVAEYVLGKGNRWPRYRDGDEKGKEFFKRLMTVAKMRRMEVDGVTVGA